MTRIIAGLVGGRRLRTPPGAGTRPTSERVREALFAKLDHDLGSFDGCHVLDLFAGSGALGLEAASRGADEVMLVEAVPAVARIAAENARQLGLAQVQVRQAKVAAALVGPDPATPFDLVLADPPYDLPESDLAAMLLALARPAWLGVGATVVLERSRRSPQPPWAPGLVGVDERTYGDTRVWFARYDGTE